MSNVVKYESKDGQEITLNFETVRKYLVSGKSEYVTDQELVYYMAVCKSGGLNPFIKDAYLIKYSRDDAAAIITSIDYFRKRARAQPDCVGWKCGPICLTEKGEIRYSKGLVLEGERLIGGWFSAKPTGWDEPFELEVNLAGYIKTASSGHPTKFWREENQPTMITKVAESQGLRRLWPDQFQGTYVQGEIRELENEPIDITPTAPALSAAELFADLITKMPDDVAKLKAPLRTFIEKTAELHKSRPEDVMAHVLKDDQTQDFVTTFVKWHEQQKSNVRSQPNQPAEPETDDFEPVSKTSKEQIEELCTILGYRYQNVLSKHTVSGKAYWKDLPEEAAQVVIKTLQDEHDRMQSEKRVIEQPPANNGGGLPFINEPTEENSGPTPWAPSATLNKWCKDAGVAFGPFVARAKEYFNGQGMEDHAEIQNVLETAYKENRFPDLVKEICGLPK